MANQTKVSDWLKRAGRTHKTLELLIQEVSRQVHLPENSQDWKFYSDTSLEETLDNGYLYRMQYVTAYHGILDIVKYGRISRTWVHHWDLTLPILLLTISGTF